MIKAFAAAISIAAGLGLSSAALTSLGRRSPRCRSRPKRSGRKAILGIGLCGLFLAFGLAGTAAAQTCSTLPYTLSNGQTADAVQLMADLNCAALKGAGSIGIGIGIATPQQALDVQVPGSPETFLGKVCANQPQFIGLSVGNNGQSDCTHYNVLSDGVNLFLNAPTGFVALRAGNNDLVRINPSGYVGIGTTAPLSPLSVSGQVVIGGPYRGDASLHIIGAYGGYGRLTQMSAVGAGVAAYNLMASNDSSGNPQWWSWGVSNGTWEITPGNGSFGSANPTFAVNGGSVGVGKIPTQSILDINGEITTNGGIRMTTPGGTMKAHLYEQSNDYLVFENTNASGGKAGIFFMQSDVDNAPIIWVAPFAYASDRRMKKNVEPVADALSIINKLRPVRYDWLAPSEQTVGKQLHIGNSKRQIGFIAQEVATVVPEAVNAPANADDPYTMDPAKLIPILVQAIKEQQAEIDQLKARDRSR